MTTYEVTPANFGRAIRAKMKRDRKKFIKAAKEAVNKGLTASVAETNRQGIVDRGQYKAAFKTRRLDDGAELRNDAPYASILEHGRRPGAPGPPFQPIRDWVARKLVKNGSVDDDEESIDEAAWAIRNAIHLTGTPPFAIFKTTRPKIFRDFRRAWKRRLGR